MSVTGEVVRWCADGDVGWSEISWSHLDESNADGEIARHIDHFAAKGLGFAWRVTETDSPEDLGARLERAGFVHSDTSTLMIARVTDVPLDVELPPGVTLSTDSAPSAIDQLIDVHERVFGSDHSQLRRTLLRQFTRSPQFAELVVAKFGDVPVAASRAEFLPHRDFAGLWGGSTLPEWRGQGIFRAMVARRAHDAQRRGYRYLYVIASSESRPIFERLSFQSHGPVATYMWTPPIPLAT